MFQRSRTHEVIDGWKHWGLWGLGGIRFQIHIGLIHRSSLQPRSCVVVPSQRWEKGHPQQWHFYDWHPRLQPFLLSSCQHFPTVIRSLSWSMYALQAVPSPDSHLLWKQGPCGFLLPPILDHDLHRATSQHAFDEAETQAMCQGQPQTGTSRSTVSYFTHISDSESVTALAF